jgi:hypothetical protein
LAANGGSVWPFEAGAGSAVAFEAFDLSLKILLAFTCVPRVRLALSQAAAPGSRGLVGGKAAQQGWETSETANATRSTVKAGVRQTRGLEDTGAVCSSYQR